MLACTQDKFIVCTTRSSTNFRLSSLCPAHKFKKSLKRLNIFRGPLKHFIRVLPVNAMQGLLKSPFHNFDLAFCDPLTALHICVAFIEGSSGYCTNSHKMLLGFHSLLQESIYVLLVLLHWNSDCRIYHESGRVCVPSLCHLELMSWLKFSKV